MKTKQNVMKKLMLFTAAIAFCVALVAKPVDVKAAIAAPTGLVQTEASSSYFTVEWNENVSATKYGIQYSLDKVTWSTESTTTSEYKTYYSMNAGKTYYVRVRCYSNSTTAGAWSSILAVDTAPTYVNDMKQSNAGEQSVTASWTPVAGATGYAIYYAAPSDSNAKFYKNVGTSSVTVSGLPKNSRYYIYAYAYRNAANPSKAAYASSYDYAICITAPTKPTPANVGATAYNNSNPDTKKLTFTWTPTSSSLNTDGYEVEVYQLKTNGKTKRIKKTSTAYYSRNYVDVKSSKLFSYASRFRVRAYVTLDNGTKVYSPWSSYKNYVPQAVQKKLKAYTKTSGKLTWKKVNGAKNYTIYYKTSSSSSAKWKKLKTVKGTSATVKLNYYGRSYYYVKANKVKFGKKKLNSVAPKKAAYWEYWTIW